MDIILSVKQEGQAGFKALLACWLNTGLSVTNVTCYWHPRTDPLNFAELSVLVLHTLPGTI